MDVLRNNRTLYNLVITTLLGAWLFTYCHNCLAHTSTESTDNNKSGHCGDTHDPDANVLYAGTGNDDCLGICDCDEIDASIGKLPDKPLHADSPRTTEPATIQNENPTINTHLLLAATAKYYSSDRALVPPLQRSCVLLN